MACRSTSPVRGDSEPRRGSPQWAWIPTTPPRVISSTPSHTAGPNEVFANDRWHLHRSDVMLVNLDLAETIAAHDAPFFTIGEMFLGHAANLPIITVGKVFRGRPAYEAIVTRTFDELDAAVDYIIATYARSRS